jgi:hypothetical protein
MGGPPEFALGETATNQAEFHLKAFPATNDDAR